MHDVFADLDDGSDEGRFADTCGALLVEPLLLGAMPHDTTTTYLFRPPP